MEIGKVNSFRYSSVVSETSFGYSFLLRSINSRINSLGRLF